MTITLTERDDGGRVRAHVGDTIEVRLPENASTGYRWALDDLDTHLFELSEAGATYPHEAIGSGGEAWFRITVLAPGNAAVRLKYWRQWEGEGGVAKRFTVEVEATPS
ncbi:protease inhibitor I42 family protein [Mycobacterium sp.]|jgi:inhibitor of cysteine peptidase|uniref:protease inhibitor I42 family protein n=1 Tax=Mycobacterium sp. TaxID=1785 RepID=UPI003C7428D3